MISEILIETSRIDISADISALLTFAIDDVRDFASRQTTFSKTVVLPGTANNNAIFGNIFETGHSNDYNPLLNNIGYNFNASKSARCLIFQDNLQTFKGTMRMLEIIKDRGSIEYEVALNGELTTLNVSLSAGLLSDLDFSAYDLDYTVANIEASWDNVPGTGVFFPLIDYGTYSDLKHDWKYGTFRPALYVKEYIDKMFTAANFRYTCDLFETARFEGLVVPHNMKQLVKRSSTFLDVSNTNLTIDESSNGGAYAWNLWSNIPLPIHTTLGNFTSSVGDTIYTYTPATSLTCMISLHITGTYTKDNAADPIYVAIEQAGFHTIFFGTTTFGGGNTAGSFDVIVSENVTINTGDSYNVSFFYGGPSGNYSVHFDLARLYISNGTNTYVPIGYGELITINDSIPQNVRQVDFLLSIVKQSNLYVYESQFDERLILIKPFVDFYSTDSSNAVDWTYKLNRDAPVRIKPMSELNSKIYQFNYKEDSDFYNEQYKKRYNQGYGSYIFDSQYEFATATNKLELVFAPTPMVGYQGEDKVYSTIFKKSGTTEECIDSVIRILQTKKVVGVTSWDILDTDGVTVLGSYTDYGYAGHLDDPDNPDNDLNFGVLKELYFTLVTGDLTKTQFNIFWSAYLYEVTHKDSKMLIGKFYLTPKDIFDLDFSKYVYVDGVLFRLNKITDYNTTLPSDCEVQLLKVIDTIY